MVFFDNPLSWLTEQSRKKVVREKNVQNFLIYIVVKKNLEKLNSTFFKYLGKNLVYA